MPPNLPARTIDQVIERLRDIVDEVQRDLEDIWPVLRWFNRYLGSVQEGLINFSIETARERAWDPARALNAMPRVEWPTLIRRKDGRVSVFAALIRFPGVKGSAIGLAIRLGEPGSTRDKIRTLGSSTIVIDQGNRPRETNTGGRR